MPFGRYLVNYPTMVLFHEAGHHVSHTVPAGAFITIDIAAFDGVHLVEVTWDDRRGMMFTEVLQSNAELVD